VLILTAFRPVIQRSQIKHYTNYIKDKQTHIHTLQRNKLQRNLDIELISADRVNV